MVRFYGLLIVRVKVSVPLSPGEQAPIVIAQETLVIGSDSDCDVQLHGLVGRHALLIADRAPNGGMSLVNICDKLIHVEQSHQVDLQQPVSASNGAARSKVGLRRTLRSGDAVALNNETLIDLGSYELEFRLAPGLRDRPKAEEPLSAELFQLRLGQALVPPEVAALAEPDPAEPPVRRFVLKPGDERVLDIQASSIASNVQDIAFKLVALADSLPPIVLPPPSWARLRKKSIQLQTTAANRATAHNAVELSPPRRYTSRAGSYTLQVRSQSNLALGEAEQPPSFRVALLPYVDIQASMARRKLATRRQGSYTLEIRNSSNWAVPLLVELNNPEDALVYQVRADPPASIRVERLGDRASYMLAPIPAGQTVVLQIAVRVKSSWSFGRSRALPFSVTVSIDSEDRGNQLAELLGSDEGYKFLQDLVVQNERSVAPAVIDAELTQRRLPYLGLIALLAVLVLLVLLAAPALPLTAIDLVGRYSAQPIQENAALTQTIVADGQVVLGKLETVRAPLAATLAELHVPETCQPSPSVEMVNGCRLDSAGDVAVLRFDAQQAQLAESIAAIDSASQSITNTEALWQAANAQASLDLERARQDLRRLSPEGGESQLHAAAEQLQQAEEHLAEVRAQLSSEKTAAQIAQSKAATELEQAQRAREQAKRNLAWVDEHGTHPTEQYMVGGQLVPRPLTEAEIQQFTDAYSDTERLVLDATQVYSLSLNSYDVAVEREKVQIQQAERALEDARDQHLATAKGATAELIAAEAALRQAELGAETASRHNAEQLAATFYATRARYNRLLYDYGFVFNSQPRQADLLQVQQLLTDTQRLLAGASAPSECQAKQSTDQSRDALFDAQLAQKQRHRQCELDNLLSSLQAVRDLTARVQDTLKQIGVLSIPSEAHIVAVPARKGDQLAANALVLSYYVDSPIRQVIAHIEPVQTIGLSPRATLVGTAAQSESIALEITQMPTLFGSANAPPASSQAITLSGALDKLALYTPVKIRFSRTVLPAPQWIVPERAIFSTGDNTTIRVRSAVIQPQEWLAFVFPSLRFVQLDRSIPVRVDATADGQAAITILGATEPQKGDRVLVK